MLSLSIRRAPIGVNRSILRLASTKSKPLVYGGRIAKPKAAEPAAPGATSTPTPAETAAGATAAASTPKQDVPLGPGEVLKPEKPAEIKQLAAFMKKAEQEDYQKRYKSFSSKVIRAVVAAPILIVTTYYLYQRVFLGQERKRLSLVTEIGDDDDEDEEE